MASGGVTPTVALLETLKLLHAQAHAPHDEIARARRHTIVGVVPNRAATDSAIARSGPDEITPPSGTFRRALVIEVADEELDDLIDETSRLLLVDGRQVLARDMSGFTTGPCIGALGVRMDSETCDLLSVA